MNKKRVIYRKLDSLRQYNNQNLKYKIVNISDIYCICSLHKAFPQYDFENQKIEYQEFGKNFNKLMPNLRKL